MSRSLIRFLLILTTCIKISASDLILSSGLNLITAANSARTVLDSNVSVGITTSHSSNNIYQKSFQINPSIKSNLQKSQFIKPRNVCRHAFLASKFKSIAQKSWSKIVSSQQTIQSTKSVAIINSTTSFRVDEGSRNLDFILRYQREIFAQN